MGLQNDAGDLPLQLLDPWALGAREVCLEQRRGVGVGGVQQHMVEAGGVADRLPHGQGVLLADRTEIERHERGRLTARFEDERPRVERIVNSLRPVRAAGAVAVEQRAGRRRDLDRGGAGAQLGGSRRRTHAA